MSTPTEVREKHTTARWKIVVGGLVLALGSGGAGVAASSKGGGITLGQLRGELTKAIKPLEDRVTALEAQQFGMSTKMKLVEADIPFRLTNIEGRLNRTAEDVAFIRGLMERRASN